MIVSRSIKFAVAVAAIAAGEGHAALPSPGAQAPDFVLKSVAGNNVRLSEYRGEVVMVVFWAAWCGDDCRAQLEHAAELHSVYRDAGLALVAVSLDEDRDDAASAARSLGAGYPVLHDAGGFVGRLYDVDSLPTLILVDRRGVVRRVFVGYETGDEQAYRAGVRDLLREL
ncbi:MAG TPA: TlpA disulfide reductase family protein [Gammaproteobacteria bacterium]